MASEFTLGTEQHLMQLYQLRVLVWEHRQVMVRHYFVSIPLLMVLDYYLLPQHLYDPIRALHDDDGDHDDRVMGTILISRLASIFSSNPVPKFLSMLGPV